MTFLDDLGRGFQIPYSASFSDSSEKITLLRKVASASISLIRSSHIDFLVAQSSSSNFLCICNLYGCMPSSRKYFWIDPYDTFSVSALLLIDVDKFSAKCVTIFCDFSGSELFGLVN